MKKFLVVLLAALMVVSMLPTVAFAAGGTWTVQLEVSENTIKYNGENALEVGFGVQSDNLSLKTIASAMIAVDLNVFDFITKTGAAATDVPGSDVFKKWNANKYVYSKWSDDTDGTAWNVDVYYASSGMTGYILIQPSQNDADEFVPEEVILGSILLGFKQGKSAADLTANSIRFAAKDEALSFNQSSVVLLTDGKANGEKQYYRKTVGSGKSLVITPIVNWNGLDVIPADENPEEPDDKPTAEFPDLEGHWGKADALRAVELGLFKGYADGRFGPNDNVTRAQFVTVLWRMAGCPETDGKTPFTDIARQSAEFRSAIAWAYQMGYINGTSETTFNPTGDLTREAAMKILYLYAGGVSGMELLFTSVYDSKYTDSGKISSWAKRPLYWGIYNCIISGTSETTLSPKAPATRAQLAKILVRYIDNVNAEYTNA